MDMITAVRMGEYIWFGPYQKIIYFFRILQTGAFLQANRILRIFLSAKYRQDLLKRYDKFLVFFSNP